MILSEDKKIIFFHIPRTGGTTIRSLFNASLTTGNPTASMMEQQLGSKFSEYYTFTFVRNPWDMAVSLYYFLNKTKIEEESFPDWAERLFGATKAESMYMDHFLSDRRKNRLVQDIFKFENFETDVTTVLTQYNMTGPIPHFHKSDRRDDYRSYYTNRAKDVIYANYKKDIALFGYEF